MKIFVETPIGSFLTLDVESNDTVQNVKLKIQDKEGLPPDNQTLIRTGSRMDSNRTLSDYGINNEDLIILVWKLNK